jgi:hypothetical protein
MAIHISTEAIITCGRPYQGCGVRRDDEVGTRRTTTGVLVAERSSCWNSRCDASQGDQQ